MTQFGFNVGETKAQVAFDPLPPGWYAMRINKAEEAMSEKAGRMLKVEFEIVEHAHPEFASRRAFANFCHHHDNKQTRDIARAQIAAICQSIGKPNASTIDEMLGCELRVKLSVVPPKDGYDARNETKGFKSLSEVVEPTAAAPTTASASAASAAPTEVPKKQPWKRS